MYYVYCLICRDKHTYIGCTNNLKERLIHHKKGMVQSTKNRLPIKLTSYYAFSNKHTAFNFEQYLKSSSGRSFIKKHNLIT